MPSCRSLALRQRPTAGRAFALAAVALLAACGSMEKDTLRSRLLDLEKNQRIREHGLSVARVELTRGAGDVELTYLSVACTGERASDVPVVLVHGTPSTLCSWVDVIFGGDGYAGLAATHDVVALEVAGHGMARADLAPYDYQVCADFVRGALRALDLGPVHLVGNSYGGEFAWRVAVDAPELVASLTLLDSSGYARPEGGFLPEEEEMRDNGLARIGWMLNSEERVASALEPHFAALPEDRSAEVFLVCENAHNWRAMVDLVRDENGDRSHELGRIAAPTLLVWGERDLAYPVEAYGRRFAQDIPQSTLVVVPDAGHYSARGTAARGHPASSRASTTCTATACAATT